MASAFVNPQDAYKFTRLVNGREPNADDLRTAGQSNRNDYLNYLQGQSRTSPQQQTDFFKSLGFNNTYDQIDKERSDLLGSIGQPSQNYMTPSPTAAPGSPQEAYAQRVQASNAQSAQANAQREAFNQTQRTEQQKAVDNLQSVIKSQPTLLQQRESLANELNLPSLRLASSSINQAMGNLQQTLSGLPQNIQNQTRGFDVNAGRLAAITRKEADPLNRNLADLGYGAGQIGAQLSGAENELTNRLGLAREDQNLQLLPARTQIDLMGAQQAREATGFNQGAESQLQLLRDRQDAGERLTTMDFNKKSELEMAERGYQQELKKLEVSNGYQRENLSFANDMERGNLQFQNDLTRDNSRTVVDAGGNQLLINPITGTVMKNLGATNVPQAQAAPTALQQQTSELINSLIKKMQGGTSAAPTASTQNPMVGPYSSMYQQKPITNASQIKQVSSSVWGF